MTLPVVFLIERCKCAVARSKFMNKSLLSLRGEHAEEISASVGPNKAPRHLSDLQVIQYETIVSTNADGEMHRLRGNPAACNETELVALRNQIHELLQTKKALEAHCRLLEKTNVCLISLASTDSLTGLANRRIFCNELSRQVARAQRTGGHLSLLLIDVDNFKQYNDTFGHPAGDAALHTIGHMLYDTVREGDFTARYGGEEFAIIPPDTGRATALQAAERVRAAIGNCNNLKVPITISIGLAPLLQQDTAAALVKAADTALYAAKAAGRNRVICAPDRAA